MAIKETQGNFEFDQVDRTYKRDTINAIANAIYHSKNQENIPESLIYFLDMYREPGKLSYDGTKKRFLSHYIPANEFGAIRSSRPYKLSHLATKMVEGEINPKEYISIVMLNYMESLNGEIKNLMHCILEVIKKMGNEINLDQLVEEVYFRDKNHTRILIKLLNSTYYFKKSENDEILNFNSDIFKIEKLLEITAKRESDAVELGVEHFRNQENYSDFITVNKLEDYKFLTEQNKIIEMFSNTDPSQNKKKLKKVSSYQKIVYGAPGTGKSYSLDKEIKENFHKVEIEKFLESNEDEDRNYWVVGAFWNSKNMLEEFTEKGYWENGHDDKYIDKVKEIKVNDLIAIKSSFNRKEKGVYISCVRVKAIGIVTKNYGDGKKLDVDWKIKGIEKDYDNISLRTTVQKVTLKNRKIFLPLEEQINFINKDSKTIEIIPAVERVTFYDGYTHGQFVGAYKPVPVGDDANTEEMDITYTYVPGPLFRQLVKALNNPNENFVLVIEEINRARADRVFGNVFQLLDRDSLGNSEYPISLSEEQEKYFKDNLDGDRYNETIELKGGLYLPSNLYIWATMNSADQGVYPMDSAFKRRWDFKYIGLDDNSDKFGEKDSNYYISLYKEEEKTNGTSIYQKVEWNKFRKVINDTLLNERVPEDRLLAPFFIKPKDFSIKDEDRENLFWITDEIYESKILMYLFDDVLRHRGKDKIFNKDLRSFSELISAYRSDKNIFNEKITEKMLEGIAKLSEKRD